MRKAGPQATQSDRLSILSGDRVNFSEHREQITDYRPRVTDRGDSPIGGEAGLTRRGASLGGDRAR